jgi:hypothetical protein
MFTYLNMPRAPEAEFEVGGRHYGVFAHNWQAEPALAWLDVMGTREQDERLTLAQLEAEASAAARSGFVVLSHGDFEEAVRSALRDLHRPTALGQNPLLRSRLLSDYAEGAPGPRSLRALLREATEALKDHPRDARLHRVLHRTYFEPAATQELAADALGLPFSTYRRHLVEGVRSLAERLWRAELHGLGEVGSN